MWNEDITITFVSKISEFLKETATNLDRPVKFKSTLTHFKPFFGQRTIGRVLMLNVMCIYTYVSMLSWSSCNAFIV